MVIQRKLVKIESTCLAGVLLSSSLLPVSNIDVKPGTVPAIFCPTWKDKKTVEVTLVLGCSNVDLTNSKLPVKEMEVWWWVRWKIILSILAIIIWLFICASGFKSLSLKKEIETI